VVARGAVALEFTDSLARAGVATTTTTTMALMGNVTSTAVSVTAGPNYLLGPWDNVVVARFPDEHSSSASSAIAAFFVISSVCSVLWPTFFFAYRWNLFALLLLAGDIACHCLTFFAVIDVIGGGAAAGVLYIIYAAVYVVIELALFAPLVVTAISFDSWNGNRLTRTLPPALSPGAMRRHGDDESDTSAKIKYYAKSLTPRVDGSRLRL
jgi:hypothetical protein